MTCAPVTVVGIEDGVPDFMRSSLFTELAAPHKRTRIPSFARKTPSIFHPYLTASLLQPLTGTSSPTSPSYPSSTCFLNLTPPVARTCTSTVLLSPPSIFPPLRASRHPIRLPPPNNVPPHPHRLNTKLLELHRNAAKECVPLVELSYWCARVCGGRSFGGSWGRQGREEQGWRGGENAGRGGGG